MSKSFKDQYFDDYVPQKNKNNKNNIKRQNMKNILKNIDINSINEDFDLDEYIDE